MPIAIDKKAAAGVLLAAIQASSSKSRCDAKWIHRVERLSAACQDGHRTHIAFLGTALLAKATNSGVDVFALKSKAGTSGAYSARALAQYVLAPLAFKHRIDLGVSGREPLNNQPYFRMVRVDRPEMLKIAKSNAATAVNLVCDFLEDLNKIKDTSQALAALASFVWVRKKHAREPVPLVGVTSSLSVEDLLERIGSFVTENSEGGKRAQAVVAGLMDFLAGEQHVVADRINDPDRRRGGDVAVRNALEGMPYERVLEVRDKPVSDHDVRIFCTKACGQGVGRAAVVAVSKQQGPLDMETLRDWAASQGVVLSVFIGWDAFVRDVFFWSRQPMVDAVRMVAKSIYRRLERYEVSVSALTAWRDAVSASGSTAENESP